MLCSWMGNACEPSVKTTISCMSNAKTMCDSLKTRCSVIDGPRVDKLWSDLSPIKQNETCVMSYYTKLFGLWVDLSSLSPLPSEGESGTEMVTLFERLKTYRFLMGLDEQYGSIQTNILNKDPLPTLDCTYAMIVQEESNRVSPPLRNMSW